MQQPSDSAEPAFAPPESAVFSARLFPHRSLGRRGTSVLILLVGLVSFATALPFVLMGAWPVGGFFGLDVLALYICFRINNRDARRYEEVVLSRIDLMVRKVCWRGRSTERRFNPAWVRLKSEEDPAYGVTRLAIVQRREELEIGSFLAPFEKADFARAFRLALAEAKR